MIPALVHVHGTFLGGVLASLVHGFAWSVGWLVARSMGLGWALVVLGLGLIAVAVVGFHRRRAAARRASAAYSRSAGRVGD